jgi:putative oxidoreductase
MNTQLQNTVILAGRILLAVIFILSGFDKIIHYAGNAGYMASAGIPLINILLPLAILVELGGGLAIACGWKTRWAAAALCLFIIPTTLVFHAFWTSPAAETQMQMIHFMKNLAIMGGMLVLAGFGPGAWALERGKTTA